MNDERGKTEREKFCNLRVPLLMAVAIAAGIVIGFACSSLSIIFPFVIAAVIFVATLVLTMIFLDVKSFLIVLFVGVFFFAGFLTIAFKVRDNASKSFDGYVEVSGEARIKSVSYKDGEYTAIAENFSSGNLSGGVRFKTRTSVSVGDIVKIEGKVKFVSYEDFNVYPLKNSYDFEAYYASVTVEKKTADFFSRVSSLAEQAVLKNMGETEGGICVALLLGDTRYVGEELYEKFSLAGVAHIFAVSGLHVGFLATAFAFVLEKLGIRRIAKTLAVAIISFVYAGFCGFSVSSLRAVIMCAILGFSTSTGLKYDFLNSISTAFVAVMLLFPESLFAYGTLLSFGAVYSVAFLSEPFSKIFAFMPKNIGSACSVSASVFFGTFPIIAFMSGQVSLLTILFNVLTIPLIGVLFTLLFIGGWITAFVPALAFLLKPAEILSGAIAFVYSEVSLSAQVVKVVPAVFPTVLLYAVLFVVSDKFNFPESLKKGAAIALPFCLLAFI
ncbi:MAG TPA: hypothetical protein DDY77_05020 [Clostridiales bacterium]|nr:hypothetical protein [Clostridiales bacterium]